MFKIQMFIEQCSSSAHTLYAAWP